MFDIWGFLLQTLTVSGVAALILVIKVLFKNKLFPKWQFAVWSVLGIMMLLPAGLFGRYTLFYWQVVLEIIKSWLGDYSFTKVLLPIPIIRSVPQTLPEWLFGVYVLGVLGFAVKYLVAYCKLRKVLKLGDAPCDEKLARIGAMASERGIKIHKVIEVSGLPSAFVCGVIHPVLVIPAENELNEKIILHELFHLKNRDTLWSVVICAFRCLHWCNPLIVYCANRAINDMESRCDQYVLEQLEGEERREYGHILLSMANDRFSKTPGSTCINNGGKNIKARIENIARFKKYPKGMELVSVCILLLLVFPLVSGAQAVNLRAGAHSVRFTWASARSIPCTTPAGAFDTYGKAMVDRNGYYRAMCAPEDMQKAILTEMLKMDQYSYYPLWNPGFDEWSDRYYLYNLKQVERDVYEGLLVLELNYPPDGQPGEVNKIYLAVQNLRVEKENGRWVAIPLEDFRHIETERQNLAWGCTGLPGMTYAGESNDMRIEVTYQTIYSMDSGEAQTDLWFATIGKVPQPNGVFSNAVRFQAAKCVYLGSESDKAGITHIGLSLAPVYPGENRPANMRVPNGDHSVSSTNGGELVVSKKLNAGWDSELLLDGSGNMTDPMSGMEHPQYFAADLYLNHKKVGELNLVWQKGEAG